MANLADPAMRLASMVAALLQNTFDVKNVTDENDVYAIWSCISVSPDACGARCYAHAT